MTIFQFWKIVINIRCKSFSFFFSAL